MGKDLKKKIYIYNWKFAIHLKLTRHCKSIISHFFKKEIFKRKVKK